MPSYNCTVLRAGTAANGKETSSPVIYIMLTDAGGAFANYWFYAAESSKREMLTVALAAIASGAPVNVLVDIPKSDNSPLTRIDRLEMLATSKPGASKPPVLERIVDPGLLGGIRPPMPPDLVVHNLTVTGDIFLTSSPSNPFPVFTEGNS